MGAYAILLSVQRKARQVDRVLAKCPALPCGETLYWICVHALGTNVIFVLDMTYIFYIFKGG